MKLSPEAVAELQEEWAGVVKMRDQMKTVVTVTFAGGALTGTRLRSIIFNLPLLLAFDVLKQTLAKAKAEKLFKCKGDSLGALMDCAGQTLEWTNWKKMDEAKDRRNEIAHDGALFDQKQCLKDIDSIENQLSAWKIIDAA